MEMKLVIVDNYVQVIGSSLEDIVSQWEDIANNGQATLEYVEDVEHHGFDLYEIPAEIAKDMDGYSLDKVAEHGTRLREIKIYFPENSIAE
jgi:hypothetical protein